MKQEIQEAQMGGGRDWGVKKELKQNDKKWHSSFWEKNSSYRKKKSKQDLPTETGGWEGKSRSEQSTVTLTGSCLELPGSMCGSTGRKAQVKWK